MKKAIALITALALCLAAAGFAAAEPLAQTGLLGRQLQVDEGLKAEMEAGYPFEEAAVIVNPYGVSPLTAVIVFTTEEPTDVSIRVKGKTPENDITGSCPEAVQHLVPVYGLYSGAVTEVELTLGDGRSQVFSVETESVPATMGEIKAEAIAPEKVNHEQITVVCALGGLVYGVDNAGDIRWYYTGGAPMGVHPLKNGHLMTPTAFTLKSSYYKSGLQEIDWLGRVYRDYEIPGGQHHDFFEMGNGNLLVAGDAPDLSWVEDYVVEIDRNTGKVVWEADMKDLLNMEDGKSASMALDGTPESDWFHNNSLCYDEKNDLILLSARHRDAIVAVRRSDKTVAWILGDPKDWNETDPSLFFKPVGDGFEWFYAQHNVTMLDNGDIMLFDNGTAKVKYSERENRVKGEDLYSRAVIYRIDTENMTVSQVFEYGKERGAEWYSDWISGVESLDGTADTLWITAGSHLYDPENNLHGLGLSEFKGSMLKSTHMDLVAGGELAYELTVSGSGMASLSFRSLRYPMYAEGMLTDISTPGEVLGTLGRKPQEQGEDAAKALANLENPQPLTGKGWTFTLDEIKLSFSGQYSTQTPADQVPSGLLILHGEQEDRAYAITSNATATEDGTGVSVNGWVGTEGLGTGWQILLYLDGQVYDTGYTL